MNNYLKNQPPEYSRFINNQVLTESQLNAVLNHLNYQDKRTRTSLIGVGIVCGLKVEWSKGADIVKLTKGVAVTTDGDLLHLDGTEFKGVRPFEDANARYPFFRNEKKERIKMWELTEADEGADIQPVKKFSDSSEIDMEQAVTLLYLEYYYREPEDCSPVDCNTGGEEVIARPRVLIVSDEDAKVIRDKDSILSETTGSGSVSLASKFPPIFPDKAIHNHANSLDRFYEQYNVYFDEIIDQIDQMNIIPVLKEVISDHKINYRDRLKKIGGEDYHPQYIYDFYRDLAEIHNRISRSLQKRLSICAPDPDAFPKHLMLGRLRDGGTMRHSFYPSPALNHPTDFERIKQELSRMLLMIREFDKTENREVRITPSASHEKRLTERAVPFYYNLERSAESEELLQNWGRTVDGPIPNYYGANYPEGFNPLRVSLVEDSFYRVEGVHGRQVTDAQEILQDLKREHGLAFKVVPIAIGGEADEDTIDYDAYRFYFEDLQAVLQAWNEENECMLEGASEFLSEFSFNEPGRHKSEEKEIKKERDHFRSEYSMEIPASYIGRVQKIQSGVQMKRNAALNGLSSIEGGIGKVLVEKIDRSDSANDIRAQARDWLDFSGAEVDQQMVDRFVYEPVELIAVMKETEDFKITDIADFTEENLERYVEALQKQCERFKNARIQLLRYLSGGGREVSGAVWIDRYVQVLNSVSESCCLARKVRVLYEQVLERKKELLVKFSFETYFRKHPGAEHLAGVPKGGTLILVYNSADGNTKLNHGRVVGDLCLPYICCSDTPSTTFVFPEQPATLLLPTDHICMGDSDEDPVRLEVSPADAEVKAFIGDEELEDVIRNKENGIYFDPNGISKDNYEGPIRFTVNDQVMEPTITLFEKPAPEFSMDEEIRFEKENRTALVTFLNQTAGRSSLDFIWQFGNGETSDSGERQVTALYFVKPGEDFKAEVTLTAKGEYCRGETTEAVTFHVPEIEKEEVSLELPTDEVCLNLGQKTDPIQIKVSPEGGAVQVYMDDKEVENVVEQSENGQFLFLDRVPEAAYGRKLTFTVNGEDVEPALTLFEKPMPQFSANENIRFEEENSLAIITIINQTDNRENFDFEWRFDDGSNIQSNDREITHSFQVKPGALIEMGVTLRAANGPCTGERSDTITIEVPDSGNDEEEKECRKYATEQITRSRDVVKSMNFSVRGRAGRFREAAQALTQVYDRVLDELDSVLEGGMDRELFNAIGVYQNQIQLQIFGEENITPQDKQVGLSLYYELALLYFYVHSCRESSIGKLPQNARIPDWGATTNELLRDNSEILTNFLEATDTVNNFEEVNKRFRERYGEDLQPIMRAVLSTFHKYGPRS